MTLGFAVLVTASAAVLTGCGGSGSDDEHEVSVVGTGEVRGAPDILNADLGIEVTGPDVSSATDAANAKAQAMINAITAAGVKKEDVRTSELSIRPEYANPGAAGGANTISGYQVTNSVRVVVRDLESGSKVLNDAVAAGGNDARLSNVSYAIDDDSKLLADARARAFENAKDRAQQYASLAGMKLGKVRNISESHSGSSEPRAMKSDAAAAPMALEPGTQTVSFTVSAKWDLK